LSARHYGCTELVPTGDVLPLLGRHEDFLIRPLGLREHRGHRGSPTTATMLFRDRRDGRACMIGLARLRDVRGSWPAMVSC
jgi:hypothetical protein